MLSITPVYYKSRVRLEGFPSREVKQGTQGPDEFAQHVCMLNKGYSLGKYHVMRGASSFEVGPSAPQ